MSGNLLITDKLLNSLCKVGNNRPSKASTVYSPAFVGKAVGRQKQEGFDFQRLDLKKENT
jgi:hypothetical protein